jgi:hypothetical protein
VGVRDLRLDPLEMRKAIMEEEDRPLVFHHACKLGLEGIVSKRKDSRYRWPLAGLDQEQERTLRR